MARKRYKPEEIVGKLRQAGGFARSGYVNGGCSGFARNASVPGGSPRLWQDPT